MFWKSDEIRECTTFTLNISFWKELNIYDELWPRILHNYSMILCQKSPMLVISFLNTGQPVSLPLSWWMNPQIGQFPEGLNPRWLEPATRCLTTDCLKMFLCLQIRPNSWMVQVVNWKTQISHHISWSLSVAPYKWSRGTGNAEGLSRGIGRWWFQTFQGANHIVSNQMDHILRVVGCRRNRPSNDLQSFPLPTIAQEVSAEQ